MLVCTNDGRVQENFLEIRILGQRREHPGPHSRVGPSRKTSEYRVPETELLGQISPWTPRPGNPQDGLDESTVILCAAAPISHLARQHSLDPCHACRDPKDRMETEISQCEQPFDQVVDLNVHRP